MSRLVLSDGVVLERVDQDEDDKGKRTTYQFTGERAHCEAQRVLERQRGAKAISLKPAGGKWELISTYPFNAEDDPGNAEPATDTHDLDSTMSQQDVFLNPKLTAALSESLRETLQNLVQRYKSNEWKTTAAAIAAVNAATSSNATALAYFKLIAFQQVDTWIFYRQVYSRTIAAASPLQVQASHFGTQKLWTTAALLAWENLPSDWWFQLPTGMVWHKSVPRVTTNIGRSSRTEIRYQYIGSDEASTLLYDEH